MYILYKDASNQWRWRYIAANNKIIADSAEAYWNKDDAMNGINLMKESYNAPVYER